VSFGNSPAIEDIFRSTTPARDKFLSRLFGLFSGDVVRNWSQHPSAPYEDIGRPTLRVRDEPGWHTLDFTLRRRTTGELYVSELKCELEFDGYRYLRLTSPEQLAHHGSAAFKRFLRLAENPSSITSTSVANPCRCRAAYWCGEPAPRRACRWSGIGSS